MLCLPNPYVWHMQLPLTLRNMKDCEEVYPGLCKEDRCDTHGSDRNGAAMKSGF